MSGRREFDTEFGITPFNGLRAFTVDIHGRLRGIHYDHIVPPGLVEAHCGHGSKTIVQVAAPERKWVPAEKIDESEFGAIDWTHDDEWDAEQKRKRNRKIAKSQGYYVDSTPDEQAESVKSHMEVCSCGFYSYYLHDGALGYMQSGTVAAVVENSGYVFNGTKGMRSTKMKVVALAHHTGHERYVRRPPGSASLLMRFNHKMEDLLDILMPFGIAALLATIVLLGLATQDRIGAHWLWFYLLTIPLVWMALAGLFHDNNAVRCPYCRDETPDTKGYFTESECKKPRAERMDKLRANYPGVPIYSSVREMLKHHPVDVYKPPSPPTPATHDGFWEKRNL